MFSNCLIFNDTFFKQIKGTVMLSLPLSDNHRTCDVIYWEENIHKADHALQLLKRYIGNVFLVAWSADISKRFITANSAGSSIQFTIEFEANCPLSLLDNYRERKKGTNIQITET